MTILVVGGAGYIGSHLVKQLHKDDGIIVYDSLENGHIESIPKDIKLIKGNLNDSKKLNETLKKYKIKTVMHFASYIGVGESVKNPLKYYQNNLVNSVNLLNCMIKNNIKKIVFSSSAAVYGIPNKIPITESESSKPINPYGYCKSIFENILKDYNKSYGLNFISLRYFNAAGADPSGTIGEDHNPETHIIPILMQVALGKRAYFELYGEDYQTKDGSCIRDYIHVNDIARAHILALDKLDKNESAIYNLGNGKGFSVKEIIKITKEFTEKPIEVKITSRRAGDPAILVASSDKIKKELKWKPEFSDIYTIIETAWNWHKKHPNGYKILKRVRETNLSDSSGRYVK